MDGTAYFTWDRRQQRVTCPICEKEVFAVFQFFNGNDSVDGYRAVVPIHIAKGEQCYEMARRFLPFRREKKTNAKKNR